MRKKSFTLIEFILVIVIVGILSLFLAPMMKAGLDAYFSTRLRNDIVSEARLAINRLTREIRQIDELLTMASTDLSFKDINNETVRFYLQQCGNVSCLKRSYNGMDNIMVNNLGPNNGLEFRYLDANGAVTGIPGNVRTIQVKILINAGGSNFTIQSSGGIRNAGP